MSFEGEPIKVCYQCRHEFSTELNRCPKCSCPVYEARLVKSEKEVEMK